MNSRAFNLEDLEKALSKKSCSTFPIFVVVVVTKRF